MDADMVVRLRLLRAAFAADQEGRAVHRRRALEVPTPQRIKRVERAENASRRGFRWPTGGRMKVYHRSLCGRRFRDEPSGLMLSGGDVISIQGPPAVWSEVDRRRVRCAIAFWIRDRWCPGRQPRLWSGARWSWCRELVDELVDGFGEAGRVVR